MIIVHVYNSNILVYNSVINYLSMCTTVTSVTAVCTHRCDVHRSLQYTLPRGHVGMLHTTYLLLNYICKC